MAEKNWTTGFPAALDSNTNMPSLTNGDTGLPSQSNAVKDAVIQIENVLGSDNLESGSVRQKVEALEQNSATKTLLDSYATLLDLDTKADLSLLDDYAQKTLLDSYAQLAHNTQHQSGGSDAIKLDDLAAADDNTDLNASASAHGLLPKLSNIATEFLNGQGNWATPAGGGGGSGLVDGYLSFPERISDPSFIDNYGNLYTKQDDDYGTTELFYQDSLGNVTQITQDGYLATYNSLRGVRLLTGTNFIADNNSVVLFAKNVGGVTEFFIKDDLQNEIQVTSEGSVVSSPINISNIDGYISFFGNELDPNVTTGTENQLVLDFSPADEYALAVYRNGLLMRRVNALSDDYQEYTLSGNVIGFLPTNVSGNWYFAQAIDGYSRFGALVDGVLQLPETTNPLSVLNVGQLYSQDIDGYSELHYQDNYGTIIKITDKGIIPGSPFNEVYSNDWFNGASPRYNVTTGKLDLGFIDEFPGTTLHSRWTQNAGTDGLITVNNNLQLQDGPSGTDIVFIHTPILQAYGFEWQFHLTRNNSNNSTNVYAGLYETNVSPGGSIQAFYIGHNRDAGGTRTIIFGEGTNAKTATAAVDAIWLRMVINSYGYTIFSNTANAESAEPTTTQWTVVSGGIFALVNTFKPNYFIVASNAFAATTSDITIRHLKFRYI